MATLNATIATIDNLSAAEKNRIIIAFLHSNDRGNVDWSAAAVFAGSKTANSFRTAVGAAVKKLTGTTVNNNGGAEASPGGVSKKRKKDASDGDAAGDGDEAADVGANKKRRGKKQRATVEDLDVNEV